MKRLGCLVGLISSFMFLPANASQLLVGVVDEGSKCPKGEATAVRPLFSRTSKGWEPIDTPDKASAYQLKKINWTIAFDGRNYGRITSIAPSKEVEPAWAYSRDYRQPIVAEGKPNLVANRKKEFGGWCNIPKNRPMVLVSKPYYKDPDKWRPFKPDASLEQSIFEAFKKSVDNKKLCNFIKGISVAPPVKFDRELANIQFYKSYISASGKKLIQVSMLLPYADCWTDFGDKQVRAWFLVDNGINYLGTSMELVDAGDYDSDGNSEIIFWYSGYNQDGYILIDKNPSKISKFLWKYH